MPPLNISAGGGGPSTARAGNVGSQGGYDGSNWAVNFGSSGGVGAAMPAPRTVGYGSDQFGLPNTFSGSGGAVVGSGGVVLSPLVLGLAVVVAVLMVRRRG